MLHALALLFPRKTFGGGRKYTIIAVRKAGFHYLAVVECIGPIEISQISASCRRGHCQSPEREFLLPGVARPATAGGMARATEGRARRWLRRSRTRERGRPWFRPPSSAQRCGGVGPGQGQRGAEACALGLGPFNALFAPLADQAAFELGNAAHNGEHQAAYVGGGVAPCFA
jgi:hypothetical protein